MRLTTCLKVGLITLGILLGPISCQKSPDENASIRTAAFGEWGIETHWISQTINPGDNFYHYVNEGWIEQAQFPPGMSYFSAPWSVQLDINDQVQILVAGLTEDTYAPGTREQMLTDLYLSYMTRDKDVGLVSIRSDLDRILALSTHDDVAAFMGTDGAKSIFHLLVQPPIDMQGGYVLTLAQYRTTGLGLPSQAHYTSDEGSFPQNRDAYRLYIAETLSRAGIDRAEQRADQIIDLERDYASIMWTFAQLRDAGAKFRTINIPELQNVAPGFNWGGFLESRGLSNLERLNLGLGAIIESASLFSEIPVEHWQSYFLFHWINDRVDLLSDEFSQAKFEFFDRTLFGVQERTSPEQRAFNYVEANLGEELGRLYFDRFLPSDTIERVEEMTGYIRSSFRQKLLAADWMDDDTRREAMTKLDRIIVEIGYPRSGPDWSQLELDPRDPIGNQARIRKLRWDYQRNRIGEDISRYGDWNMYAHRVGMGYHQQYNKIFMTAGALLPPFFDPNADLAVNYGALGQTIAHEFGHALDDQGSTFDSEGALREWWGQGTRREYESRTSALIQQFGQYETLPGVSLESQQMIGEIVGDLVGTSVSLEAYKEHMADIGEDPSTLKSGFSGTQRFFLSAAQQARSISTDDTLRFQALNASHPPSEFRTNGIFRNNDDWYSAFDIQPEDTLYLPYESRVDLWGRG